MYAALLLLSHLLAADATAAWELERREWLGDLGPRDCLRIVNPLGAVYAARGEGRSVPVIAHLQSRPEVAGPELLFDRAPGPCLTLEVRHSRHGIPAEIGTRVDLGLRVPPAVERLEVVTDHGAIELRELEAVVVATTEEGDVRLSARGRVRATTTSGDLTVRLAGEDVDGSRLATGSGDLELRIVSDLESTIEVRSSGPVTSQGRCHSDATASDGSSTRRSIRCGTGDARVRVESESGPVLVRGEE